MRSAASTRTPRDGARRQLHGLPTGHRRPAARLRGRPLRGHRGAHVRRLQRRGGGRLRRRPTWPRSAEVARAGASGGGARQPPGDGSRDPRARARWAALAPYAVKVHGSALEYTVKPEPERFLGLAREGLARRQAVLVGSRHTAASLWRARRSGAAERARGWDRRAWTWRASPRASRRAALPGLRALVAALRQRPQAARRGRRRRRLRPRRARRLPTRWSALRPSARRAGRLRRQADRQQGRRPAARSVAAGARARAAGAAGGGRLRRLPDGSSACARAAAGDLERAGDRAAGGRSRGAARRSRWRTCWRSSTACGRARALPGGRAHARRARLLTGRLDHEELADAAARVRGAGRAEHLPGGVRHGRRRGRRLRSAADQRRPLGPGGGQRGAAPRGARRRPPSWLSFPVDDRAVQRPRRAPRGLAWESIRQLREQTRAGLVSTVRERWSWEGVARGVIAAARGDWTLRRPESARVARRSAVEPPAASDSVPALMSFCTPHRHPRRPRAGACAASRAALGAGALLPRWRSARPAAAGSRAPTTPT